MGFSGGGKPLKQVLLLALRFGLGAFEIQVRLVIGTKLVAVVKLVHARRLEERRGAVTSPPELINGPHQPGKYP